MEELKESYVAPVPCSIIIIIFYLITKVSDFPKWYQLHEPLTHPAGAPDKFRGIQTHDFEEQTLAFCRRGNTQGCHVKADNFYFIYLVFRVENPSTPCPL